MGPKIIGLWFSKFERFKRSQLPRNDVKVRGEGFLLFPHICVNPAMIKIRVPYW